MARVKPAPALETLVGWKGVTVRVPEGWSPVSLGGEGESGYMQIASPDTRQLVIRWERPRGAVSVPTALSNYLNSLSRGGQPMRVRQKPSGMSGARPPEQAALMYAWEADRKALGCIWHCGECGRLVIAEIAGADPSLAREVIRGIRDHGEDVEGQRWNTWSAYGLTVQAPERYRMERHTLVTGHQRFELRHGSATIVADRWALAEIALRGTTLREWYGARPESILGRFTHRFEESEVNGHPALRFSGLAHPIHALPKYAGSALSMRWPSLFLHGYLWHCPDSNRIYAVIGEQSKRSTMVERVVALLRCHAR